MFDVEGGGKANIKLAGELTKGKVCGRTNLTHDIFRKFSCAATFTSVINHAVFVVSLLDVLRLGTVA